jgi:predicted DNA-binding protein (UPF0251 family)
MPRPKKDRHICQLPANTVFAPAENSKGEIILTLDEYEVLRLIDQVGMTQERCAVQMQVARTTITGIYNSARHKVATALVDGLTLVISGGEVNLCDNSESCCLQKCGSEQCISCTPNRK